MPLSKYELENSIGAITNQSEELFIQLQKIKAIGRCYLTLNGIYANLVNMDYDKICNMDPDECNFFRKNIFDLIDALSGTTDLFHDCKKLVVGKDLVKAEQLIDDLRDCVTAIVLSVQDLFGL